MQTTAMRSLRHVFAQRLGSAVARLLAPPPERREVEREARPVTACELDAALDPFKAALRWAEYEMEQFRPMAGLLNQAEMLANPVLRRAYEPLSSGHEIVRQMRLDINRFHQSPTDFQRELIDFTMQLAGPRIYGLEWKTNQLAIKRYNNWTGVFHGIGAVMTGRKEGKSTGLALAAALIMFNIPRVRIALFSKTQAQAGIILGMAKDLLANHARSTQFKLDGNKEVNSIRHMETGDFRVVTAYSGSADVSFFLFFCFKIFGKTGESTLFVFVVSV